MTDPYPTGPVVYILRNGKSLYVGATIDLSHRIRQHNGELSGGAHRTSTKGPGCGSVCCMCKASNLERKAYSSSTELVSPAVPSNLSSTHQTTTPLSGIEFVTPRFKHMRMLDTRNSTNKCSPSFFNRPAPTEDNISMARFNLPFEIYSPIGR